MRPLLEAVRQNLIVNLTPGQFQSVDGQMIGFKGRHTLKQFIKNKPQRWGFKVFMRAGETGIMHDFKIYVGKNTCRDFGLGISGDVVLDLCDSLPKEKPFIIYFDN